nr:hypothetical protein [uncultured Trichococcus sp.]
MVINIKQRLASVFQKASRENNEDFDTQILKGINSVLEEKNADFRLVKENGLINSKRPANKDQ